MPELPEVENFRQLLLPLVGDALTMELHGDHPRVKVDELIGAAKSMKASERIVCTDILRRGKQICLVLSISKTIQYLFLHMGMTGRIRVYGKSENWGDKKDSGSSGHSEVPLDDEALPPKYTCLTFSSSRSNYTAYFCDPRKFGSAYLANDLSDLESLAPDALTCTDRNIIEGQILPALTNQRLGIKAILLDQKRAVSGVGNWVADEVLYQCKMHPDQTKLDIDESTLIYEKLHDIVSIAVKSLKSDCSYPENWLFHYRWTGKKSGKDAEGRTISFITSGGRTTAIINALQKLYARSSPSKQSNSEKNNMKTKVKALLDVSMSTEVKSDSNQNQKMISYSSNKSRMSSKVSNSSVIKIEDTAAESQTNTKQSRQRKRSNEQKEIINSNSTRNRRTTTKSSYAKRQKLTPNESVEFKVDSRRKSPRLNIKS